MLRFLFIPRLLNSSVRFTRYSESMTRLTTRLRPREKIAEEAPHALTVHELLQAMIGSGSKGFSVERIARQVQRLVVRTGRMPSYEALIVIRGIGHATAARMVAAMELADRLRIPLGRTDAAGMRRPLEVTVSDGAQRTLSVLWLDTVEPVAVTAIVRTIVRAILAVHGSSVALNSHCPTVARLADMRDVALGASLQTVSEQLGFVFRSHIISHTKGEELQLR